MDQDSVGLPGEIDMGGVFDMAAREPLGKAEDGSEESSEGTTDGGQW